MTTEEKLSEEYYLKAYIKIIEFDFNTALDYVQKAENTFSKEKYKLKIKELKELLKIK